MVRITHRIEDRLHEGIVKTAEKNHRSLNGEINRALEYYLQHAPEAQLEPVEKDEQEKTDK